MSGETAALFIDDQVLFVDAGPIPHIIWDSETVPPSGAILRKAKGIECLSTPFHTDGWAE